MQGPTESETHELGELFTGELTVLEILRIFSLPPNQVGITVTFLVAMAFTNTFSIVESVYIPILNESPSSELYSISSIILASYLIFYVYQTYLQRSSYLQTQISDVSLILCMLVLNLVGSITLSFARNIAFAGTLGLIFVAISLVGLPASFNLTIKMIGVHLPQQKDQIMAAKKYISAAVIFLSVIRALAAQWNIRLVFPNATQCMETACDL